MTGSNDQSNASASSPYDAVLDLVAENDGIDAGELIDRLESNGLVDDPKAVMERAVDAEDVLLIDDRYWIMRKGKYAYDSDRYDVGSRE